MEIKKEWVTAVLIITMLAGVFLFGLRGQPTEMGLIIVACAICLAFTNINKIQKVKGAGFEAEMKKAVEEAYATTESLRSMAKPLILSTLDNIIFAGRWGEMDNERKHKLKADIDGLAKSLGVFDKDVESASQMFFVWHAFDHVHKLETVLSRNKIKNTEIRERLRTLADRKTGMLPSVQDVRCAIVSLEKMPEIFLSRI